MNSHPMAAPLGALALLAGASLPLAAQSDFDASRLRTTTATEIAAKVCAGTWRSTVVTGASLVLARTRPELNAFVTIDDAGALRAAIEADATHRECKPLHGVPIYIKDNIHVAGLPSTAGTLGLAQFVPSADAPVVKALREAGAVILGKTHMHELAFGISGYNPNFTTGPEPGVRNAYDARKMAGGSSSGNGAALGARLVTASLGTDTGGSVRIPCALNGCTSLRPTVGRYAQDGIAPISHTRDTAGPMAVSMLDVELLDRVITRAARVPAADLKSVRLGLVRDPFLANLDGDTQATFDAALVKLRGAGVTTVDVAMPGLADLNAATTFAVAFYEPFDDVAAYLQRHQTGVTLPQLVAQIGSADVKGVYEGFVMPRKVPGPNGTIVDAAPAYAAAMSTYRPALQQLYADTFANQQLDAIVFPTVPRTALDATPDSSSFPNLLAFVQNVDPGSNAGVPGMQLPIGFGATSKLPIGLELDGPPGSDRRLISVGIALEKLFGRLPPPTR